MKKLLYAAAFTFVLAFNAPTTLAGGAMRNANVSHLVHSGAHPNNARFQAATIILKFTFREELFQHSQLICRKM